MRTATLRHTHPLGAPRTAPLDWRVLARANSRRNWPVLAVVALLTANLGLYVASVVKEAALNRLQLDLKSARHENIRLRTDLAAARSPKAVEAAAVARGMVPAQDVLFARLHEANAGSAPAIAAGFGAPEGF